MAFEEGTHEFTCEVCKALNRVRWSRLPVRERSTVKCKVCGGVIYDCNAVRDYYGVELIAGT